jgi:hypothetical protein
MPNVSDVSIKMQDLRSTTLQIAANCGKVRANTRHTGCGDCARRLGLTQLLARPSLLAAWLPPLAVTPWREGVDLRALRDYWNAAGDRT